MGILLRSTFYVALNMQSAFQIKLKHLLTAKMPYFCLQVISISFILKGTYTCYSVNRLIMCLYYYLSRFHFLQSH